MRNGIIISIFVFQFCMHKERKSYLDEIIRPSSELLNEIKEYFIRRSEVFAAKDTDGYGDLLTTDSVMMVVGQKPVVGRSSNYKLFACVSLG